MKKLLIALTVVVIILVCAVGFLFAGQSSQNLTASGNGENFYTAPNFLQGFFVGPRQQLRISNLGNLVDTVTTAVHVLLGSLITNSLTQGAQGFSNTFSTSTAITAAQFCATTNMKFLGSAQSGAVMTSTLPSATSSWVACGSPAGFGGWQGQILTNDSTSTINIVAGPGMTFMCETQGVGTTTLSAGVQCTASQITLNATSTIQSTGFWDAASGTMKIMWGNEYH